MKNSTLHLAFIWLPLLVITAALPQKVWADERTHRQLAEKYMDLTGTQDLMQRVFDQLKVSQIEKLDVDYSGKSADKDRILMKRVEDYLDRKLVWSQLRKGYAEVFAKEYSEAELKDLVKFYSSPVGQKVLNNSREVQMQLLQSTQVQLKDIGLELMKIKADFVTEQKQQAQ